MWITKLAAIAALFSTSVGVYFVQEILTLPLYFQAPIFLVLLFMGIMSVAVLLLLTSYLVGFVSWKLLLIVRFLFIDLLVGSIREIPHQLKFGWDDSKTLTTPRF